jgi:hypothetical protein
VSISELPEKNEHFVTLVSKMVKKKTSGLDHKANLWCDPKRYFFLKKKSLFFEIYFFVIANALTF